MPFRSVKQRNLFEMIAHGGKPKNGKGPSVKVAKKFIKDSAGSPIQQDDEPGVVISEADYRPSKKKRGKIRPR